MPSPPAEPGYKWVWHEDHWDKVAVKSTERKLQNTVPTVAMPKPAFPSVDPKEDPVKAAYKRLEYISNNRNQWGNFSPKALELMDELTPLPELSSSEDGDCGEGIRFPLDELSKLKDPRSAELLVAYQMDSGISGNPPDDALVAMGPAAVPALIARLDDASGDTRLFTPLYLLPQIVAEHRSELGGIVQHIIIPKIEAIAAYEGIGGNADRNRQYALRSLEAILRKTGPFSKR